MTIVTLYLPIFIMRIVHNRLDIADQKLLGCIVVATNIIHSKLHALGNKSTTSRNMFTNKKVINNLDYPIVLALELFRQRITHDVIRRKI